MTKAALKCAFHPAEIGDNGSSRTPPTRAIPKLERYQMFLIVIPPRCPLSREYRGREISMCPV